MMKKKYGRWTAALLTMAFLVNVLGGCGKGETQAGGASGTGGGGSSIGGDTTEQSRGRYVETEVALPEELADWTINDIFSAEDRVHLLATKEEDGKTTFREWEQQESGFVDVTQGWLASMELECGEWMTVQLMEDGDGTQYLFAAYVEEGAYKGHLWRGEGEEAKVITPEKWEVPDEDWGGYAMIQGVAALDNGALAAVSYSSMDLLSGEDGAVIESEPISAFYDGGVVTDGENVYLSFSDSDGVRIEKRKNGKGDDAEIIPFSVNRTGEDGVFVFSGGGTGSVSLGALKDGTLIAAGEDGIFRLEGGAADAEWEMLLEGVDTDFALADSGCMGLAALENGCIYALMLVGEEVKLNRYEYDPDAVNEVTTVLKLYTVQEDSLLKQAATMYHKQHPEVLITIQSAYPMYYYGETDYNEVYQTLNTMLMGDAAPDILVMDHLNMDSYASKGLLADLDSVVRPMEESGGLLSNITGAYVQEDGSRYVVPLQFRFPMALGRDIAIENMASIEALADFLEGEDYSYMGSRTAAELVSEFYPYFCQEIVRDKQLDKEAMGRILEYLKAIGDNCGMVDSRDQNEVSYGMWELAGEAKFAIQEVTGFINCMMPMSMVDYIKGDFTAFENQFIPSLQMGICTKSQYPDVAQDFLRFALSESIQDTDYYRGFPVNRISLKKQAAQDRSNFMVSTAVMADDGSYIAFDSKDYPEETADRILAICETLDKPVGEDAKIQEVLTEALGGYLNGTQSKDETIQKIEGGLKMYLAE